VDFLATRCVYVQCADAIFRSEMIGACSACFACLQRNHRLVAVVDAVFPRLCLRFLGSDAWGFRQAFPFDRMGVGKKRVRAARWRVRQWLMSARGAMLVGIP
jgi:hypothetical protein